MEIKSILDIKKSELQKMSDEQTQILLRLMLADSKSNELQAVYEKIKNSSVLHSALDNRLKWIGIKDKVDKRVEILLGFISPSLGAITLWCYALYKLTKKYSHITLNQLCEEFPWGFPSEQQYAEYWDMQKGFANKDLGLDCDNVLDQQSIYA
ncbi:hypothetical protein J7384_17215 [Endozoicomonas sp. G2_1]|uniref:hypothetical protein n=1 Tax=Endozoicomonas sp. G2_1 TaxID=2821091 RepID=UPI001ADCF3EE|nr:hypothetical protein [Endozoicomonas sp. G2_1]MBO9492105.1 hypothetical protein [Endozoicomonas sp. G2_1]